MARGFSFGVITDCRTHRTFCCSILAFSPQILHLEVPNMTESPANATFGDYDNGTETYIDDDGFCIMDPDPSEVIAQTLIHSIICGFGLIGNVLVMVTYIFYKRTKTMTDVYLFNVAVADLIFVATLPFVIYNEQHDWSMGRAACKVLRSSYSINLYSGMLLLACISCDRYIAIVRATRSFGARSRALVYSRLICSATETAALVKLLVPSLQMAVGFLLPLCVMAFCYSSIIYTLLRAQSNQRHKAVRVVLAVVVVFIVCHLPYNVTLLIHTLSLFKQRSCDAENLKLKFLNICRTVAYLHCCLNPFLYAFVGVKFRNHFRQIMLDLWCFSKRYIYTARSSLQHLSTETQVTTAAY
uniref:C-C motif chemokine receptor 6 n=1 Tax=Oreochromis niloticus TaxID=8128 RepID=A0A669EFB6_ORENI